MPKKKTFFKMYGWLAQNMRRIGGAELKILIGLSYLMGFNDNTILMEHSVYDILEEQTGMNKRSILRALRKLEEKQLIKRGGFFLTVSSEFSGKGL